MSNLGTFSVSLAVQDLVSSRAFYEKLGFAPIGGDEENWLILANGDTVIGLFQQMFEANIMTFNPGWVGPGAEADEFTDVRELKARFEAAGLEIFSDSTGDSESGPANFSLIDPDGNPILFDQHV